MGVRINTTACLFHQQTCFHRYEVLQWDQSDHVLALLVAYQALFHMLPTMIMT